MVNKQYSISFEIQLGPPGRSSHHLIKVEVGFTPDEEHTFKVSALVPSLSVTCSHPNGLVQMEGLCIQHKHECALCKL